MVASAPFVRRLLLLLLPFALSGCMTGGPHRRGERTGEAASGLVLEGARVAAQPLGPRRDRAEHEVRDASREACDSHSEGLRYHPAPSRRSTDAARRGTITLGP